MSASRALNLRVGDWVEVRSAGEILATLDEHGRFEAMPFMPQMLQYCGGRFRVVKRAHKLCDTVHGTGARKLDHAVFLDDLRCDGTSHGSCEMECRIVWKEAWLKRADERADAVPGVPASNRDVQFERLRDLAVRNARQPGTEGLPAPVYACQATAMPAATTQLSVWDPRQYLEDVRSGNARVSQVVAVLTFLAFDTLARSGLGFGTLMRWSYDRIHALSARWPYPGRVGKLPQNTRTPSTRLGLRPGELVRVKTHGEVLETVSEDLVNRGMRFHPEMVPYCGKTFRVGKRLRRLMNEKTGQILELKNECLVLEGTTCAGRYTAPLLCPRGMAPYWREIWLQRVEPGRSREAELR